VKSASPQRSRCALDERPSRQQDNVSGSLQRFLLREVSMKPLPLLSLLFALLFVRVVHAEEKTITITVTAGKHDCKDIPVCVPLSLPKTLAKVESAQCGEEKAAFLGQLTAPGITTEHIKPADKDSVRRDLHFILPSLKSGASMTIKATVSTKEPGFEPHFAWHDTKGKHADLQFEFSGRPALPVMRYMYRAYDPAKGQRELTYKVFHHLFDPEGKRLVTNGGETDENIAGKKLLYPHHRGLMYAFNKITFDDGKQADTWHAKPGDTHQSHEGFAVVEGGPVLGRHRVLVDWHGPKKEVFAKEERELTVYKVPGGTLVEFASKLRTAGGKVKLDGDPQHAGFQFRAANEVAEKSAKETYFVRPDGIGKPGETRNWDPKKKGGPVDLPWNAMSFVLGGQRYTVGYFDHQKNPHPSRYSERDYGRFGCYFVYELDDNRPLVVNYRIWLQKGEMTVDEVARHSSNFVTPPTVTVK
jgi:hypothetical protein